jgi:hypothetical protein
LWLGDGGWSIASWTHQGWQRSQDFQFLPLFVRKNIPKCCSGLLPQCLQLLLLFGRELDLLDGISSGKALLT